MWKLTSKPFVRKDEHFAFKLLRIKNSNTYIPLVQIFHPTQAEFKFSSPRARMKVIAVGFQIQLLQSDWQRYSPYK